jgi:hypothetical protein
MGGLQINLEQIDINIKALEGKLAHEKSKFQDFSKDLKETQKRYPHHVEKSTWPRLALFEVHQFLFCLTNASSPMWKLIQHLLICIPQFVCTKNKNVVLMTVS